VDLIRDVLDKKAVDRHGRELGRIDGITLELRSGAAPRVASLDIGPSVLAGRISPVLRRWAEALEHVFGVAEGRPLRLSVDQVLNVHDHVKVDVAFGETAAATVEQRVRRWIARIPGSS
jgi:hypothetical protein